MHEKLSVVIGWPGVEVIDDHFTSQIFRSLSWSRSGRTSIATYEQPANYYAQSNGQTEWTYQGDQDTIAIPNEIIIMEMER